MQASVRRAGCPSKANELTGAEDIGGPASRGCTCAQGLGGEGKTGLHGPSLEEAKKHHS